MYILLLILVLPALMYLPSVWVRSVMKRYSEPADRYGVTGGEAARRLLDLHGLEHVGAEATDAGDHYSPGEKMVRLSEANYSGKSLTAIVIAAHEVGHAVQDATGYPALRFRTQLVRLVGPVQKVGAFLLMASPVIVAVTRVPAAGGLMLVGGFLTLGTGVLVHVLTLPSEIDASFSRALPMLEEHEVLISGDEQHARRLLNAAAMTYVSAALMSLLNVARWWAILRR